MHLFTFTHCVKFRFRGSPSWIGMGVQGFAYVSLPYQQKKETLDFYQNILEFKIVSNEIVNIQKTSEDDVWLHNYDSGLFLSFTFSFSFLTFLSPTKKKKKELQSSYLKHNLQVFQKLYLVQIQLK